MQVDTGSLSSRTNHLSSMSTESIQEKLTGDSRRSISQVLWLSFVHTCMYILHHKTCGALQKGQPNDDLATASSVSWSSRGDRVSSSSTRMSLSLNFCSDSKSSAFNNGMLSVATTTITSTATTTTTTTTTTTSTVTTTTKPLQPLLLLIIFSWSKDSLARPYLKVLVCIYANARYCH